MLFCNIHLVKVQSILHFVSIYLVLVLNLKCIKRNGFIPMIPSSSSNDDSADQDRTEPVDDLKEGDEAEAEEEAKYAS